MSIPDFDAHGNLSAGPYILSASNCLVRTTVPEMYDRFVIQMRTPEREQVWQGWMDHRTELEGFGMSYSTWINGSFTTTKPDPSDIDVVLLMSGPKLDALPQDERRRLRALCNPRLAEQQFRCHTQLVPVYPFESPNFSLLTSPQLSYWTRVFGLHTKNNQPKAILVVESRGVS